MTGSSDSVRAPRELTSLPLHPAAVGQPPVRLGGPSGLRDYLDDPLVTTDAPTSGNQHDRHDGVLHRPGPDCSQDFGDAWTLTDPEGRRMVLAALRIEFAAKPSRQDRSTGGPGQD